MLNVEWKGILRLALYSSSSLRGSAKQPLRLLAVPDIKKCVCNWLIFRRFERVVPDVDYQGFQILHSIQIVFHNWGYFLLFNILKQVQHSFLTFVGFCRFLSESVGFCRKVSVFGGYWRFLAVLKFHKLLIISMLLGFPTLFEKKNDFFCFCIFLPLRTQRKYTQSSQWMEHILNIFSRILYLIACNANIHLPSPIFSTF